MRDNLQPLGGGAYVAEIDGNLTTTMPNGIPDSPLTDQVPRTRLRSGCAFQLRSVTHQELKTARGKSISTVVATVLSAAEQDAMTSDAFLVGWQSTKTAGLPGRVR